MADSPRPQFDNAGRTVIVTGGTKGIGRGVAERYLASGANVVVCSRNEPDDLPRSGDREAVFVECNVRDPGQVEQVVAAAVDRFDSLDVLVNNAGGAPFVLAADASPRFSASIIDLNLTAPLVFATAANSVMQQQESGGVIVNVASVSGTRPSPGTAAYGAAKAGLLNLTESLAVEWAPKVRCASIVAGLILTEQAHLHYGDDEGVARVAETIPMARLGTPDDIADACLYLSSPLASYVTGGAITLHGGGERPAFLSASNADDPAGAS